MTWGVEAKQDEQGHIGDMVIVVLTVFLDW
jgi:hypothetical protein